VRTEEISILKLARLVVKNAGFKIENSIQVRMPKLSACAERLRPTLCQSLMIYGGAKPLVKKARPRFVKFRPRTAVVRYRRLTGVN